MTPFFQSRIEITFRHYNACLDIHPRSDSTELAEAVPIASVGGIGFMRIVGYFFPYVACYLSVLKHISKKFPLYLASV